MEPKKCFIKVTIPIENILFLLNTEHFMELKSTYARNLLSIQGASIEIESKVFSTKLNSLKYDMLVGKINEKSIINLNGPINDSKSEFLIQSNIK